MRRALALSQGAELHLIVGDTRRVVDEALGRVMPHVEVAHEMVRHGESPRSFAGRWLSFIERAVHVADEDPVVLDAWDPDPDHEDHWSWVFSRLNERRNEIMRGLARPLVLVVSPDTERLLGRTAPDLWTIRGVGMRLRDRARLEVGTALPLGSARVSITRGPAVLEPPAPEDDRREMTLGPDTLPRVIVASRRARKLHGDGRQAEALESADEAVGGYEALVERDEGLRLDLARALLVRADVLAALGRRAAAAGDLRRATMVLETLQNEDPERADVQRELLDGYAKLGDLYLALEQPELAARRHARASELRASLSERESPRPPTKDIPSVFISYSHDSAQHAERVRVLAEMLLDKGVEVCLDQYVAHPVEGWPRWVERRIAEADFVIVVCTPTYRDRFEGSALEDGRRVGYEQELLRALTYERPQIRVIPVLFPDAGAEAIPIALRGNTFYRLPQDYEPLYRRVAGQPTPLPTIGRLQTSASQPSTTRVVGTPVTMLLFSADPSGVLDLAREQRAITAALDGTPYDLRVVHGATIADVVRELDDHRPSIVHFSGHTDPGGGLTLVGEKRVEHVVTSEQVARLLEQTLPEPPLLVVFATSHSTALATKAARNASYSIGFEGSIRDEAASLFSSTFYERLASKPEPDVPRAFVLARLACISSGYEEVENARLYEPPGREVPGT